MRTCFLKWSRSAMGIAVFCCLWVSCSCVAFAGSGLLREGNALYRSGDYVHAQERYQSLIKKEPGNALGFYNLGLALYKQKDYEKARGQFNAVNRMTHDRSLMAKSFYNIGNTYLNEKKWTEAIDAYKKSLRLNPTDQDAKYNLAYAQKHLKNNDNSNKDNKKNKDKDNKDKGPKPPSPSNGGMNQEQADNMLNALRQQEQNLQKKKEQNGGAPARPDKDW